MINLAPGMLRWYYDQALKTGSDFFMLPPSGELYAYPAAMSKRTMELFVKQTEDSCLLLNTNATMDWEWFFSWRRDIEKYLPLYAKRDIVRGLFAVNVPYLFPITPFSGKFKVCSNMSRPCLWQSYSHEHIYINRWNKARLCCLNQSPIGKIREAASQRYHTTGKTT